MQNCAVCAAALRPAARFCARCGAAVRVSPDVPAFAVAPSDDAAPASVPVPVPIPAPVSVVTPIDAPVAVADLVLDAVPLHEVPSPPTDALPEQQEDVPSRIPSRARSTAPPARSAHASWAFAAGAAPLVVSVTGNLIAAQLGATALERVADGEPQGAWAGVLVTLALVFVLNAGLLTVCAIAGARGIRETGNGVTRGRGLAIAGLAVGALNLVLWVAGLAVSVTGLEAVLS